jgi:arylsulfotransferase ASST
LGGDPAYLGMMASMRARRTGLTAGILLMLVAALSCDGAADESTSPLHEYVTLTDRIPPVIDVTAYHGEEGRQAMADPALFFLGPKDGDATEAPLIVDSSGEPVWIGPDVRGYDLRVQHYQGKPVLTWWRRADGDKRGAVVLMNQAYQPIATVSTDGVHPDFHETTITPRGTALLIGHRTVIRDLSSLGGPKRGFVKDSVVQEVDIATGRVLFEWSALDHVPLTDSRVKLRADAYGAGTKADAWDFAHINSITEDGDSLLISARNTCAVYRVNRTTGDVDWTLGGESSDFRFVNGARFIWQHDAMRQPDGTITIFDNHGTSKRGGESRGLRLSLDMVNRAATTVREYRLPGGRLAGSQGNMQVRENGNVILGWGASPTYSEFTPDGQLLLDADFGSGESYRVYRLPWVGRPITKPTLIVEDGTATVSWNGATEVTSWRFLAGADAESASAVKTVPRDGFETSVEVPDKPYVAVEALGADGTVLSTGEVSH